MPSAREPILQVVAVVGGYVVAFLVASAGVAVRVASTNDADAQAASGMYAFGDMLLFVAVFGLVGLVPTSAALYFLRPYRRFWTVLAALACASALTGTIAAVLYAVGSDAPPSPLATLAGFSVLRVLVAPLFALVFVVCTLFAPYRSARLAFLAASALEAAVSLYGGIVWFIPLFFRGA